MESVVNLLNGVALRSSEGATNDWLAGAATMLTHGVCGSSPRHHWRCGLHSLHSLHSEHIIPQPATNRQPSYSRTGTHNEGSLLTRMKGVK